ncbi:tripartite motif-containing protein 2-like [Lingula anatina]|uniref:Tripartite motif-containing protein 2-like n=1 Tax=Lingula anatina TaxID=7574 RepID=A0A1S3HIE6_LINAN|nr:tripartite motif-containing protein 2-like [Lingula anatina]|eukprot:XP_013385900.1 tripartite motif-containing protein 2-like [Lingula anatina]
MHLSGPSRSRSSSSSASSSSLRRHRLSIAEELLREEEEEEQASRTAKLSVWTPTGQLSTMTSTLVETVSINYEDFNDSFLTCGTCLCQYDAIDHTPKLLPCSHTVCRSCLERIIEAQTTDTGTFRCPICRETITIPRGGVASFPPSFIVNQLLDLFAQQRRDIIPKCSSHGQQELLFCETCDTVFCTLCTGGEHNGRGASEHTVIPFSIAIKRMSEILLYKAHLCIRNLNTACDNVGAETHKLEHTYERTIDAVNRSFQDLIGLLDKRRQEVLQMVKKVHDEKKRVLQEQLDIIQAEKEQVQSECQGLQYQIEVRNITKKISDLNEKLDTTTTLSEPRENAFIKYDYKHNSAYKDFVNTLNNFGKVKVSTTFPSLSTATIECATTFLKSTVTVSTVDYHGNPRTSGCDPITAELRNNRGESQQTQIKDKENGTYEVTFTPQAAGQHTLSIKIFDRPIKESPFSICVSDHNNPIMKIGSRGCQNLQFTQPVGVAIDQEDTMYVLDTGNSRIKILSPEGEFIRHLGPVGLENQSGTGIAMTPNNTVAVVNWRTKHVTEMDAEGTIVKKFTNEEFLEPISLTVNSRGEYIVTDNGAGKLFLFDTSGNLIRKIGSKGNKAGEFNLISAVAVNKADEILVADNRLQKFGKDGRFLHELDSGMNSPKGQYSGLTVDRHGNILALRSEKGRSYVQVFNASERLLFTIDSHDDKLKRPSGLAATQDFKVVVVDLGNDCIKKFRYK